MKTDLDVLAALYRATMANGDAKLAQAVTINGVQVAHSLGMTLPELEGRILYRLNQIARLRNGGSSGLVGFPAGSSEGQGWTVTVPTLVGLYAEMRDEHQQGRRTFWVAVAAVGVAALGAVAAGLQAWASMRQPTPTPQKIECVARNESPRAAPAMAPAMPPAKAPEVQPKNPASAPKVTP